MPHGERRHAATRLSDQGDWRAYFQGIDDDGGLLARVVAATEAPAIAHGGVVHRLHEITYDARADAITVGVREPGAETPFLRYFVSAPRSITIEKHAEVTTIAIVDAHAECTHVYLYPQSVTLPQEAASRTRSERDEAAD